MELLAIPVGLLVLTAAAVDLFRTVLDYDGYGPISQRLYRLAWKGARALAAMLPPSSVSGFLASAGPLMLLASVAFWLLLAVVGFALLYLPGMPELFSFEAPSRGRLLDALYVSATSLSTVGFGDVTAAHPALRVISTVEALTGFAILTLTISYLLGVYEVIRDQSTVAALVEDQADDPTDPLAVATSLLRHDATDATLSELHRDLVEHNEGVHRYPIVYYFRRRTPHRSALYVLRIVGEAAAFMRWVLPESHPSARSPALAGLIAAQRRLLTDVRQRFLDDDVAEPDWSADDRWRAAVRHLDRLGIDGPAPEDGSESHAAWREFMTELVSVVTAAARELRMDEREIGPMRG